MSRKQLKISNILPPPLTALVSLLHAMVNKSQALVLLTGLVFTACGPINTTDQDEASADAPFSIEDVPPDAPLHYVSVKFPLDWEPRTLAAREYKGFLVYSDSILGRLGEVPEADETTLRVQSLPDGPTWQNKNITYSVGNLRQSVAQTIRSAAAYYNENTVVKWEEAASETKAMVKFSSNGKSGSSGTTHSPKLDDNGNIISVSIELSSDASPSTVRHEMLHALGFEHEQRRPDRDTYLRVRRSTDQSGIDYGAHPIGHYDLVSKVHYDYSTTDFTFDLNDDDKVRTLFQKEVRRYNNLTADPKTDAATVHKYVGKGDKLSYLDIYALKLKYTVSNTTRPFIVTAKEETDPTLIAQAHMSSGQKLLRLSIKNNSGFDAESWALRVRFGGTDLPVGLAPLGVQHDGFLTPSVLDPSKPKAERRTEIITPMEGNSRITNGKTLSVYVVMNPGANGRLDGIVFCRLNSFDCLSTGS